MKLVILACMLLVLATPVLADAYKVKCYVLPKVVQSEGWLPSPGQKTQVDGDGWMPSPNANKRTVCYCNSPEVKYPYPWLDSPGQKTQEDGDGWMPSPGSKRTRICGC